MTNRLAAAHSLYLRKHAENPIDWWAWCDEAITTARQEDKPIFLSIGYSSCHWCTVMEGEAFSDEAIAAYMNANFLPIKVDREERPDIDSIYMQTLQMMVGQGGWPLNVFLSPDDLVPFYGGTYFPVEPRYGRPGFLQVLQSIRQFYDMEKDKLQSVRSEIVNRLQQMAQFPGTSDLDAVQFRGGLEYSVKILASTQSGTRFPMIPYAQAALRSVRLAQPEARDVTLEVCQKRGLDLALGGIYDHVAGGFHRYTVDPTWTVPHFEKMLYDNGQIVEYLANLWRAGVQEPAFERAIAGTVQWLKREMTAPEGYFYAAQDADSFLSPNDAEPEEGAFYVWHYKELEALLTEAELSEVRSHFTVTADGNFEGKTVLQRRSPGLLPESLEQVLSKLFQARYGDVPEKVSTFPPARNNDEAKTLEWPGRIPAVTDPKMIVAWNSLMISGLAQAAVVLQNSEYMALAGRAATFILDQQQVEGRLHRLNYGGIVSTIARSEDYALFIKALLDLHQAQLWQDTQSPTPLVEPGAPNWLARAVALQQEFDQHLWSDDLGGYYTTDASPDLVVRERQIDDNATPSANGVAIANLVRLFLLTENMIYLNRAERSLQAFSGVMEKAPTSCPGLFSALDWLRNQTVVKANPAILQELAERYLPTVMLRLSEDLPQGAIALVCQGLNCLEPATTPDQLRSQLDASLQRT